MHKRLTILIVGVLLSLLLLTQIVLAMSSPQYQLDWFTPLTSGGGGAASSANYTINFTIGQTTTGASTSTSYKTGLGYWYGVDGSIRVYLPVILR